MIELGLVFFVLSAIVVGVVWLIISSNTFEARFPEAIQSASDNPVTMTCDGHGYPLDGNGLSLNCSRKGGFTIVHGEVSAVFYGDDAQKALVGVIRNGQYFKLFNLEDDHHSKFIETFSRG